MPDIVSAATKPGAVAVPLTRAPHAPYRAGD